MKIERPEKPDYTALEADLEPVDVMGEALATFARYHGPSVMPEFVFDEATLSWKLVAKRP